MSVMSDLCTTICSGVSGHHDGRVHADCPGDRLVVRGARGCSLPHPLKDVEQVKVGA
jgi:hypothetical protein